MIRPPPIALVHDWNYNRSNRLGLLFPSAYDGALRAQYRQPLLAGYGREYTSIIGNTDVSLNLTGTPQGILIAQANQNVSRLDLEKSVAQLVHDVESQYWTLSLAENNLNLLRAGFASLEEVATKIETRAAVEAPGGDAAILSQIRDVLLQAEVEILNAETAVEQEALLLKRLIGVPNGEDIKIVTLDSLTTAEVRIDLHECIGTALTSRVELRKQHEVIRTHRLEQRAAQLLMKPRLDLITEYRLNGFGDELFGDQNPFSRSYGTLLSGDQTGWNAGFEFTRPVRNRLARQRLRNANLELRKAQILLREQQNEVRSELSFVAKEVDRSFSERRIQQKRTELTLARLEAQRAQLLVNDSAQDLIALANSMRALTSAKLSHQASVHACKQALSDLEFRKGRVFQEYGISLK